MSVQHRGVAGEGVEDGPDELLPLDELLLHDSPLDGVPDRPLDPLSVDGGLQQEVLRPTAQRPSGHLVVGAAAEDDDGRCGGERGQDVDGLESLGVRQAQVEHHAIDVTDLIEQQQRLAQAARVADDVDGGAVRC